ncbi:MAG: Ig-like domain-containing protein [Candidatus Omnitrophota bacterium]|nr:Ig-like domain-containing protein [Candidatus Omnitrophota bacterium]
MRTCPLLFKALVYLTIIVSFFIITTNISFAWVNLQVSASPAAISADGVSTSTITATAKLPNGSPLSGHNVIFSISPQIGTIAPSSASTNSSGQAITTYTSGIAYTTITITATDISTQPNLSANCYVSLLDPEGPTGTIKINDDAQYTKLRDVTLNLSAQDPVSGVSQMQFSNDGINWLPVPAANYATSYYPWTLSGGDGAKTIYARFYDAAGNSSIIVNDTIILDTIAPATPTIYNLTSPTNINSQTITGTKSVDTASIIITCPTATVGNITYPTSTTWSCQLTNLTEGTNSITAKAVDAAGNESPETSGTILLDTIAPAQPTIDPVTSPTNVDFQTITGTRSADTASIIVTCPTATVGQVTYPTSTTWVCQLTNLTVGDNNITATAQDAAGNPSIPRSITVTYQPQTGLTVKITSHQNNARVNTPTINVSGTVTDSTATVTVNGISATLTNNSFTALNIPLTNGTNVITAKATKGTQTAQNAINVILDTVPPSINIYTPDANSATRSNIVYGRVSDDTQTVTVNSTPAELLSDFRFIARPALQEGANIITVQAQDKAGNTSQKQITITYNTQTPKLTITSPLDNSTQNISPIKVQGTNTTDLSFILVNGVTASVIPAQAGIQNFTAVGVILDPVKTVITATAFDATDNKFQDAIVVTSPNLANYELIKVSGDATEDDPARPSAGANQILKARVEKNNLIAANEEIRFTIIRGNGALSLSLAYTDMNGEAQVTLTTDTNSDITNQVECYPTSNPLVKAIFSVDTKPAAPSIVTKITDGTITPVPGATIPLIVKLTDSNNNPIQNETINFQVISGAGTLSGVDVIPEQAGIQTPTNYYGEAKVNLTCPNLGLVTTQVKASSLTVPSVTATFNITTSASLTITVQDIIDKVNYNDSKIQDLKADIQVTSNVAWSSPIAQLKIWIKGNKQKIEEISPNPAVYIRPVIDGTINMDKQILFYDTGLNIYVIKIKKQGQADEYPYILHHIDYAKGTIVKTEYHILQNDYETTAISEYSDFVQINEAWGYQKQIDRTYGQGGQLLDTTTKIYSNIQINTGIPDSEF